MVQLPKEIESYIDRLNPEEQDRFFDVKTMVPGQLIDIDNPATSGCLMGVARGFCEYVQKNGKTAFYSIWSYSHLRTEKERKMMDEWQKDGITGEWVIFNNLALQHGGDAVLEAIRSYITQKRGTSVIPVEGSGRTDGDASDEGRRPLDDMGEGTPSAVHVFGSGAVEDYELCGAGSAGPSYNGE